MGFSKEFLVSSCNVPSGDAFCSEIMNIEIAHLSSKILST